MKKVLIWDMFPLTNTGGPAGYLYNIHEYLKDNPTTQITFLSDLSMEQLGYVPWFEPKTNEQSRWVKSFQVLYQLYKAYTMCIKPFTEIAYGELRNLDLSNFDIIHVHMVPHVHQVKKLFPNFVGKIILMSHCPCTWTDETVLYTASVKSKLYKILCRIRPIILSLECQSYKMADYLMFPCEGAKDPYIKEPIVRDLFNKCKDKFLYVPTAIVDYKSNVSNRQSLINLGIPNDAFVIGYFGRHIEVKGYDILKQVGVTLLEKHPDLFIVCAGSGNIEPPIHERWLELGFINNVDDLLSQIDLYILPNKETYFDLIVLQVLRAGVPLILTKTGGNKFFYNLEEDQRVGLLFVDNNDTADIEQKVSNTINTKLSDSELFQNMHIYNRLLYEQHFTIDKYLQQYLHQINILN